MKSVIGRAEKVGIEEFDLVDIPAKIDSGAFGSSIDCSDIQVKDGEDGAVLEFILFHPGSPFYTGKTYRTESFETTDITNANGTQQRYLIHTEIVVQDIPIMARLTLADRSRLKYPVLIGRGVIANGNFLIDVTINNTSIKSEEEKT